jgi:hypothetical protein
MDPEVFVGYQVPRPALKPIKVEPASVNYIVPSIAEISNDGSLKISFNKPFEAISSIRVLSE